MSARSGPGLVVLLGVGQGDGDAQAAKLADKVARLRVFDDDAAAWTARCSTSAAAALCISQFTLYGDTRRGLRPSFTEAAEPADGGAALRAFLRASWRRAGCRVAKGRFGARMCVGLVNEGPVTLLLEA